jgi:integrase
MPQAPGPSGKGGHHQPRRRALFWHDQENARYTSRAIGWLLIDIRRAELKPREGRTGPRIHDLRHSKVVNRILEWYRAGNQSAGPAAVLATYLGHRDIHSTLVYITVTQDLLQQASDRFRVVGVPCLNLTQEVQP